MARVYIIVKYGQLKYGQFPAHWPPNYQFSLIDSAADTYTGRKMDLPYKIYFKEDGEFYLRKILENNPSGYYSLEEVQE